jgi:hypothetical protein
VHPLRILTWHVHGDYVYRLVQGRHEHYLPVKPWRPPERRALERFLADWDETFGAVTGLGRCAEEAEGREVGPPQEAVGS